MTIETSAIPRNSSLRRRTHALKHGLHAHTVALDPAPDSTTLSESAKDLSPLSGAGDPGTAMNKNIDPFSSDDETGTECSEDDLPTPSNLPRARNQNSSLSNIDTANLPAYNQRTSSSPVSPNTRAWYEFDLAVVVALVSPIGNWLTGGDHVKNLFLIALLIFYLHQIIEVPWQLYRNARPRKPAENLPATTADDRYKRIAISELRALEFFFLLLTAISPFLGAAFLRYATAATIGHEAVSWFSTALFVLATGLRPWSHAIERLTQRTTDLHDIIHYPSPNASANDMRAQMEIMTKRIEHLEKALSKAKAKIVDATEDVYDYVDDVVTAIDRTVKKHEVRYDKQDAKFKEIEQILESSQIKGKQNASGLSINIKKANPSFLGSIFPGWLTHQAIHSSPIRSPKHSLRSFPSSSSIQLETIPEEEPPNYPLVVKPASFTSLVITRATDLITMPLRAVIRMVFYRY